MWPVNLTLQKRRWVKLNGIFIDNCCWWLTGANQVCNCLDYKMLASNWGKTYRWIVGVICWCWGIRGRAREIHRKKDRERRRRRRTTTTKDEGWRTKWEREPSHSAPDARVFFSLARTLGFIACGDMISVRTFFWALFSAVCMTWGLTSRLRSYPNWSTTQY